MVKGSIESIAPPDKSQGNANGKTMEKQRGNAGRIPPALPVVFNPATLNNMGRLPVHAPDGSEIRHPIMRVPANPCSPDSDTAEFPDNSKFETMREFYLLAH